MVGKTKINIFSNMSKSELKEAIHEYVIPHRIYERLYAMKLLSEGYSYDMVAYKMGKSYQTIHRWAKICESEGIEGLKPNYEGGRPEKLSKDDLVKLDEMIQGYDEITTDQVHDLILNEFNVEYSMKQVWVILTQKLDYKCKNKIVIPK
ncbi:MAG: transposase [Methanosphaera sp.]|nr:transposase [Methanosphaera sp.]